jgi:serine/threonine protein kinase
MPLSPGTRLGPYEILSPLGAGGMGEVYKARDTRLDRTVAIKILPADIAGDPHRRQRFRREARAISSLTHSHICTLYDVGEQDGTDFLVMEHLSGETLAHRLLRGPLPLTDVLQIGAQLADALDAAHRHGLIHRDLKPANVMLTASEAKILDFGLAKSHSTDSDVAILASATARRTLTQAGTVLGTVQYMAPEQVEGQAADARSDLFAFGAILYEMTTGRKAFEGNSQAALMSAIMTSEPTPITELQPLAPTGLDYVISRCLAKNPDDRWQTARDLLAELKRTAAAIDKTPISVTSGAGPAARARFAWTIALIATVTAVALAFVVIPRPTPTIKANWLSILPPPDGFAPSPDPSVSPDGRYVVFKGFDPSHNEVLWLKSLDSPEMRPIPGTDGLKPSRAFWSPDSRAVGFFADGQLKRIDIAGGTPLTLAPAPNPRGGAWSRDDLILFTPDGAGLSQVHASGGAVAALPQPNGIAGRRQYPEFLPDGRHFLSLVRGSEDEGTYLGEIGSRDVTRVSDSPSQMVLANGFVLFVRQRTLFAQPFDLGRFSLTGDPQRMANGVGIAQGYRSFQFSASAAGVIAYWERNFYPRTQLTWVNRLGARVGVLGEPATYAGFFLSLDGRRVAAGRIDEATSGYGVEVFDVSQGTGSMRLAATSDVITPILSPDGSRLVTHDLYRGLVIRPLGAGSPEPISGPAQRWILDWSSDGQLIVFRETLPHATRIATMPARSGRQATTYLEGSASYDYAQLSPDCHWMAYNSTETGHEEVYVDSFPRSGNRVRVSRSGGLCPKWRRDGKELYFLTDDRKLVAVSIEASGSAAKTGPARILFEAPAVGAGLYTGQFAPNAEGSRFLFNARVEDRAPVGITVIANWQTLLSSR